MKVCVIGVGYVGLTTGLCLAYVGHRVCCVDVDSMKVETLCSGVPPFHEPGIAEMLAMVRDRVGFTTDVAGGIAGADVIVIAVGTPPLPDGNPDLRYLREAGEQIGSQLNSHFAVVVNKSTVPVGSGNWIEAIVRDSYQQRHGRATNGNFAVASNPEFLREGSAVHDSLYPDRIVVGVESPRALHVLRDLYRPIVEQSFPAPSFAPRPEGFGAVAMVTADLASAELIKYAANSFLSVKISFANEIARLAECAGADVKQVMRGIGLDARIGSRFLHAGLGWGGSCFGKDTAALVATAREYGASLRIVEAAREVNYSQRALVVDKLLGALKILKGKTIGILGLAFKPDTDDVRDSPALDVAERLLARGAKVRAHDPVALATAARALTTPGVSLCADVADLFEGADALVLATEWPEYLNLPWARLGESMRTRTVVDARNCLDGAALACAGFHYLAMGVQPQAPALRIGAA